MELPPLPWLSIAFSHGRTLDDLVPPFTQETFIYPSPTSMYQTTNIPFIQETFIYQTILYIIHIPLIYHKYTINRPFHGVKASTFSAALRRRTAPGHPRWRTGRWSKRTSRGRGMDGWPGAPKRASVEHGELMVSWQPVVVDQWI